MILRKARTYGCLFIISCFCFQATAQTTALAPNPKPPSPKAAQRYEIDAKRIGVDMNSEDALPRSREFKRIDSSYYVGWMLEGVYKYNHAADYLGFSNAAAPLEKTVSLLERDFRKELQTRSSDVMVYINAFKYQVDYTMTAYHLMNCYSNMDEPVKVYALLRRVLKWNLQRDLNLDPYNFLAWTVHRNRFYTSVKYPFLKNSIDENEALANRYLDSGMTRINRNMALNNQLFQPGYDRADRLAVYHYKSILHSYTFRIDSAMHYFELMHKNKVLPHNNYATFRMICGDFREADAEYKMESASNNASDKRLQEWVYYSSILDIYKGIPATGAELTKGMIMANGSTPGFGWYNIALSRCMFYDGQLAESERYLKKATEFKELHIGTTLGQSHYDFSAQLLKLMQNISRVETQRFENKNWWYQPNVLGKMAELYSEKYLQQFLIINQFAQNPERDRVIYKLFSTESTVSWDEIYFLISDFSTNYFQKRFRKELQTDERKYIRKYYKYFLARLEMKQGNYDEANKLLNEILLDPTIDAEYEKLLIARTMQAQAEYCKKKEDDLSYNDRMYKLYQFYPQLIPYSGLMMNMQLHITGTEDKTVIERLRDCNINWINNQSFPAPQAWLSFSGTGDKKKIHFYVTDAEGKTVIPPQVLPYKDGKSAAVSIAYRLFINRLVI